MEIKQKSVIPRQRIFSDFFLISSHKKKTFFRLSNWGNWLIKLRWQTVVINMFLNHINKKYHETWDRSFKSLNKSFSHDLLLFFQSHSSIYPVRFVWKSPVLHITSIRLYDHRNINKYFICSISFRTLQIGMLHTHRTHASMILVKLCLAFFFVKKNRTIFTFWYTPRVVMRLFR